MSRKSHNRKDISGEVINSWRVLNYSHTKGKIAYYNCICLKCGKDFVVDGRNIRSGRSKSCFDCSRERTIKANTNKQRSTRTPQESAYWRIYCKTKREAKKRNKTFSLTYKQVCNLINGNCHYCGIEPSRITNPLKNMKMSESRVAGGEVTVNGIDRVDNNIGYETSNAVSCCVNCNKAKLDMTLKDFLNLVERIYNHTIKKLP